MTMSVLCRQADFDIYRVNGYDKSIGEEKIMVFIWSSGRNRRFPGNFVVNRPVDGQLRD